MPIGSPYALDKLAPSEVSAALDIFHGKKIFFDGVFKGDYSLAIVNRQLALSLIEAGVDLTVFTPEEDWHTDEMFNQFPSVFERCTDIYPERGLFDIHMRNTWPPRCEDMIGDFNAYVCFAWEESIAPRAMMDHFNAHLDLMMVTANFVEESFRNSGLVIPITVVGNGTDHLAADMAGIAVEKPERRRILHVSSCFPRKGADLLVQAFAEEFAAKDNVELLIKTFDNPHNTIAQYVQDVSAAHPGAPPMRVMAASLPKDELAALIKSASVFAAPSRGEGFGLPLAEALLLDVPVVTTNYSGQTDFCTPDTAWLVDYHLIPSNAHVAASEAQWAQPDVASLRRMLRCAVEQEEASASMTRAGQALLAAHFKWSDVARRIGLSITHVLDRQTGEAGDLRIDLVSTWEQICGIATYSGHLLHAPAFNGRISTVLARKLTDDLLNGPADFPQAAVIKRPWGFDVQGIQQLRSDVRELNGNVLWFQHHPGFFSSGDMQMIVTAFDDNESRVRAITLHNVRETLNGGSGDWLHAFDIIFVHTQEDQKLLDANGYGSVAMIPHGILVKPERPELDAAHFTVGTFGFLYPHKNVPLLVEAFSIAQQVAPHLRLKILCCARPEEKSWRERAKVDALVHSLDIADVTEIDYGFLGDDDILDRLSQCDLICFPYGASLESATGAARIALAAGRPLLCSSSTVLNDIQPYGFTLANLNATTIAEAILVLAGSEELLTIRDEERNRLVSKYSYESVAVQYETILKRISRVKAYA
jgi:glycosyltransferase involved in cell wall biosynthesis